MEIKEKTALEWFVEVMPPSVAQKAIENTSETMLRETYESPCKALISSFIWIETKNGKDPHVYWQKIYNKLREKYKEVELVV